MRSSRCRSSRRYSEGDDDITVDRYHIDGIMPWHDEEDGDDVVWLVGGEDEDVDVFLDAIEITPE